MRWHLTSATITPAAVEAFTRGACAGLAIALHDHTGWPIIEIGHCDGLPLHFMVRHPDGRLIDIEGAHSDTDVRTEWEYDADDFDPTLTEAARDAVMTQSINTTAEGSPSTEAQVKALSAPGGA